MDERTNMEIEYSYNDLELDRMNGELFVLWSLKEENYKALNNLRAMVKLSNKIFPSYSKEELDVILERIRNDINYLMYAIEIIDSKINAVMMNIPGKKDDQVILNYRMKQLEA